MTPPPTGATSPWEGDPQAKLEDERNRRARRFGEHLSIAFLVASCVVVLVGAYPMVEGMVDSYRPDVARRGLERQARAKGWAVGEPRKRSPSRYAPTPDKYRDRASLLRDLLSNPLGVLDEERRANAEAHFAVPRGTVKMYESANERSEVVHMVGPGTKVVVAKDLGMWLLVAVKLEERSQYGWVRRDEVVILP